MPTDPNGTTHSAQDAVSLFLFAHQDDEFGVFWAIERAVRNGHRVVCLYFTNGGYYGTLPERRNAESLAVLTQLGVACRDIHFVGCTLDIPDGILYAHLERAYRAAVSISLTSSHVEALFMPAWEGGHQDHDATHLIGVRLAKRLGIDDKAYQFALHHGAGLPGPFLRVFSPLPSNGTVFQQKIPWRKRFSYLRHCLLSYPSQWKIWLGLFPFVAIDLLACGKQGLQGFDANRIREQPHSGILLYERRGALRQRDFQLHTQRFLDDIEIEISA